MTKKHNKRLLRLLSALLDALLVAAGLYLARLLRGSLINEYSAAAEARALISAPFIIAVYIGMLFLTGVYSVNWKYADLRDMLRLGAGCLFSACLCLLINTVFSLRLSRAALGFHGLLSFILLVAVRYIRLLLQNLMFAEKTEKNVRRSLVIGADKEGIRLAHAVDKLEDGSRHEAVAFIDDDVDKLYRRIGGIPVEGTCSDICKVIKNKHADEVLFTSPLLRSESNLFICLNALREGCAVSRFEAGALKPVEIGEMLDSGSTGGDTAMTYDDNIALIGAGELAREIAVLASESGAGKVFCLDSDPARLSEMARAGAWVKLGNTLSERALSEFISQARPSFVFYLSGACQQDIVEGNEQEIIKQNVISPLSSLGYCASRGAKSFIYVTDTAGEAGGGRMFKCGEAALLDVQNENLPCAVVNIEGLEWQGGELARLFARARSGRRLAVREGEKRAFISCRSAAAALIEMAKTRCEGSFTIKGGIEADMSLVSAAISRVTRGQSETEAALPAAKAECEELSPTGITCVYRRSDSDFTVPECFKTAPTKCPDPEECVRLLA